MVNQIRYPDLFYHEDYLGNNNIFVYIKPYRVSIMRGPGDDHGVRVVLGSGRREGGAT